MTNKGISSLLVLTFGIVLFGNGAGAAGPEPDIVIYNGKILTVDDNFSIKQAVAIQGQQILAVGSDQEVLALAGPNTMKIDLKGRTVIPGLIDTHGHIHSYAEGAYGTHLTEPQLRRYQVDWRGVRTKDDVLNQIKGVMDKYKFKPGEWVVLASNLSLMGGSSSPDHARIVMDELNRWELDKITPNNPAAMTIGIPEANGMLLNSKAIDLVWAKYGDFAKKYGRYWIDKSGRPEGHLEAPIVRQVMLMLPYPDAASVAPLYKMYNDELAASGVTTVSTRLFPYSIEAYKVLESRGELTLRMPYGIESYFADLENDIKPLKGKMGTGTDKVWVNSATPRSVDGANSRSCSDFSRATDFGPISKWWPVGQCNLDPEYKGAAGKGAPTEGGNYFREWFFIAAKNGLRFSNNHVAGDRSVRLLLNIAEEITKQMGPQAVKGWAFDHCTLVNPKDFQRAARLGIIFSCSPKYVESLAANAATSYGEKVANTFVVPVKSMLDAGVKVVFEMDRDEYIWHDFELLLTRKDEEGKVWGPQERVDRQTALRMITSWAAEYVMKADKLGSLEPGKWADLTVLDRDYMTIPAEDVSEIAPRLTIFDGKVVYVHPEFAQEANLRPAGAVIDTYQNLTKRRQISGRARGGD